MPRHPKYPWATYTDGDVHSATFETDAVDEVARFVSALNTHAKRKGFAIRTRKIAVHPDDDPAELKVRLLFQFRGCGAPDSHFGPVFRRFADAPRVVVNCAKCGAERPPEAPCLVCDTAGGLIPADRP